MSLKIKHRGRGTYDVVDQDGAIVHAGPMTKEAATRLIDIQAQTPVKSPMSRDKEYQARLAADLNAPIKRKLEGIRRVLSGEGCDEDEIAILMRVIEPAIRAGKQAGRRERKHMVPPAMPAAIAA